VLAFGVATFVVLVVLAMLAAEKTVKPSDKQCLSIDPTLFLQQSLSWSKALAPSSKCPT
jgi:hypothetical protein